MAPTKKINTIGTGRMRGDRRSRSGHTGELVLIGGPADNRVVEAAPPLEEESEASKSQGEKS